ncbi:MAG: peptidylprolyl isomerase [Clostridia bacterium]|nr:peptidylprolyl isomerase [Clostridia bacterium]
MRDPYAHILLDDEKEILIRLRPDCFPNTVNSFVFLCRNGVYRDHSIERIVPGYVIDASYTAFHNNLAKYLIANESGSPLSETAPLPVPGTICMGGYDGLIAGGEFFFPLSASEKIIGNYPAFGEVEKGMDIILRWEKAELCPVVSPYGADVVINAPVDPIVITDIAIEPNGHVFSEPVRMKDVPLPVSWK